MRTSKRLLKFLKDSSISYEKFRHEPVRTSEEAQALRSGYTLAQGAKAIIIRAKFRDGRKFFMLVLPGDKRFDSKKVKKLLKCKSFSFANKDEVLDITSGVLPGGVPPFGNLFNVPVFVDKTLGLNEKIVFNAGDRSVSVAMYYEDYVALVIPQIVDII